MRNNKTNPAEVLKYFNNIKQAKRGAMMNSYGKGGEQQCGKPGKPKCKKKSGKRGGKLIKVLKAIAGVGVGVGGGVLFKKAVNKLNKNGN